MTTVPTADADFPAPPFDELHARLLEQAGSLEAAGAAAAANTLRVAVHAWWEAQQAWNLQVAEALSVHHEINNALVGVRGNTQLLMMGPAGQEPGLKERLEVVLRESSRIQMAAARLRPLRARLAGHGPARHAA